MDEPTASLDFGNQTMVLGRIRDLAREGYGIVLSTHDPGPRAAGRHARRHHRGRRLAAVGSPQEVVTAEMLSAIYRTEVIVEDTPSGRRVCVPAWGNHENRDTKARNVMKAAYIEEFGGPEVIKYGDLPDPMPRARARSSSMSSRQASTARTGRCARNHYGKAAAVSADPRARFLRRGQRARRGRDRPARRRRSLRRSGGGPGRGLRREDRDRRRHRGEEAGSAVACRAAALALTGLTALCSIEDTLKLKSGETILIQGGAGGVASFAIQLAKHIGARVITTASASQSCRTCARSAPTR